ncbi:hypothetical protein TIFTF001_035660 [Ficus carica]|uniref:Retrotransposon gag domain-containing protein n=1 Tax=Ficus carica TaxID=3494 RepID=A0AA88E1Z5_FICCA|nr:hypothetical protein TIFTF001_035660 [Ficus carica]
MATPENDTPDAFKGLLYPGMENSQELFILRNWIIIMEVTCWVCRTFAHIRIMLDTGKMLGGALTWWWQLAPVNQSVAPEIPNTDSLIPEKPMAPKVHVAPLVVPLAPLVRTPKELYNKFWCMKVPKFEGSTNPIKVDNWLVDLQVILNFLRLNDQEKVLCASFMLRKDARLWWETVQIQWDVSEMTWKDFVDELKEKYFNTEVMEALQDEFNSFHLDILEFLRPNNSLLSQA